MRRGDGLPLFELGVPGPLRDRLVAAVLDGSKTTTTGLLAGYELEGEPLPQVGARSVLIDSEGRPVALVEILGVQVVALAEVSLTHVLGEGEGDRSVVQWRAGHEKFWLGEQVRAELGARFTVDDATPVVLEKFRVVRRLP